MSPAARRLCEALALSAACAGAFAAPVHLSAQSSTAKKPAPAAPMTLPAFTKLPTSFEGLFAERDERAKEALGYLRCIESTVAALRAGVLGNVEKGWSLTCIKQGTEWRGIFGELIDGDPRMRVRVQFALRANSRAPMATRGMVVREPVDTVRAASTARALLRGLASVAPGDGLGQYIPVVLPQKTFTEVWFVASANRPDRAFVGGDSVIQLSVDGSRELGHASSAPRVRALSIPNGATTYTLESTEGTLPLMSELMLAHLAIDLLREVRVRTREHDAILQRATRRWTFVKR